VRGLVQFVTPFAARTATTTVSFSCAGGGRRLRAHRELAGEGQRIGHDEGSYVVPLFSDVAPSSAAKVHGIREGYAPSQSNHYGLRDAWTGA
jgi:hypothetical protein